MDFSSFLTLSTLICNEGSSRCGIHHDPICPLPALVAGPGGFVWEEQPQGGVWKELFKGGRLFLADGVWDLSYGPRDVVILDGRYTHGVTSLRSLPGKPEPKGRAEFKRFSIILFNTFKREKMKMEKTLREREQHRTWWQDSWLDAVPWRPGCEPQPVARPKKRSKRLYE